MNKSNKSGIVIFGGTFDPAHLSHRQMAEEISKCDFAEKIIILPAKIPPHKNRKVTSENHRLNMCRLNFEGIDKVFISDFEMNLTGKNYTVNTLKELQKWGVVNPFWLIGGDSLVDFEKWYKSEEILKLAKLLVFFRGNINKDECKNKAEKLRKKGGNIEFLQFEPANISSTDIREKLLNGEDVSHLLLPSVEEYIRINKLYKGD